MAAGVLGPPVIPRGALEDGLKIPKLPREFQWDDKTRSLKDLVSNGRLPFIAKLESGDVSEYDPTWKVSDDDAEYFDEPLIHVLEVRRSKAVVVRKMQWNRKSGDYVTCGKEVDIPASFKGTTFLNCV